MSNGSRLAHPKSKQHKDDIPMTPMIDVVFQLLVYFIFTFQPIDALAQLPVLAPKGGPPSEAPMATIYVNPGSLRINEVQVDLAHLDGILKDVAGLAPHTTLTLICSEDSQHKEVVSVLDLCHKHGLTHIAMLRHAASP